MGRVEEYEKESPVRSHRCTIVRGAIQRCRRRLTLIDELTCECLAIRVACRINSLGVIETLADVMLTKGIPEHIRSDNGAEMTSRIVRSWLVGLGSEALYIEPDSP